MNEIELGPTTYSTFKNFGTIWLELSPISILIHDSTELIYTTHPQAIYTSRLLNFNNLPEPRNADNWKEYSDSIKIDCTKLNINPQDKF
ncbi:hypothetical protein C1645_830018 [Glomus cerebriforme]|uniref:Uncharacterized protein n=1 Tax=Glomus cerebriforme TaxID=658196 RepID=A0A397SJY7_9GLOM|nr:hypothetical protein C1645_830018 [Glomus cerebriforme]